MVTPLPKGSTIGILGSGQLGRMLTDAAHALGYQVIIFAPPEATEPPAAQVADGFIAAAYENTDALLEFAKQVDVVTLEFENIPAASLETLAKHVPVYPRPEVLHLTQHRLREKTWLHDHGFPVVPFRCVDSVDQLEHAVNELGFPCVVKTVGFGYDGKGQLKLNQPSDVANAADLLAGLLNEQSLIVEAWITHQCEISVIIARPFNGDSVAFPVFENRHVNHILDTTLLPASISESLQTQAQQLAIAIAECIDVIGLLTVELFVTADNTLLVNELAPRPHNSGHITMTACNASQFDQHIRAITDHPLVTPTLTSPGVMWNILGDVLQTPPDWHALAHYPGASVYQYGKAVAKPGRKMAHLSIMRPTVDDALNTLDAIKAIVFSAQASVSAPFVTNR